MGGDDRWFKVGKEDAEYFMEKVLELEQDRKEWKHSQEAYKAEAEASRVLIKELKTKMSYMEVWDEREARIKELEAEREILRLRAQAVVDYNEFYTDKKPETTNCYGINGILLWQLRKALEQGQ